jgi:quercetin dioxygenase-like cupin family protein
MENLTALTEQLLRAAKDAPAGRASHTVIGGSDHGLRQTVIALRGGEELAEHASPGEATLYVLHGAVELRVGEQTQALTVGELSEIAPLPHSLMATEDAVVLLTVVKTGRAA